MFLSGYISAVPILDSHGGTFIYFLLNRGAYEPNNSPFCSPCNWFHLHRIIGKILFIAFVSGQKVILGEKRKEGMPINLCDQRTGKLDLANLPLMANSAEVLALPAVFVTTHVYIPLWEAVRVLKINML